MIAANNYIIKVFVALALASPLVSAAAAQPREAAPAAAPVAALDAAFHEAVLKSFYAFRHDDAALRELLQKGADVNAVDAEGNNALMLLIKAADGHNEHVIRKELFAFLRDSGINLHARNKDGLNAAELNCCLYWPYDFLTKEFEKAGVPISPGARLAAAAAVSNVAEVERLLQAGADPNCDGSTLMSRAVHSDFSEQLVPLLLQHGFRVRDIDANISSRWLGHLLLHRTPAMVETVNLLICHGAVLNDETWYTPYFCHLVTENTNFWQNMALARHFVELGLDATRKDKDGKTASMLAREKKLGLGIQQILGNPQAVLAERQKKAQQVDEAGRTPLMLAVADPHQSAIEVYKWLRSGADVNARDAQGRTALFYINSFCPQKDLKAKLLIEAGADVNARDAQGLTPLLALPYVHDISIPQQRSCAPVIRLLAEAGADLNACDPAGFTRLEQMLRRGNLSRADSECVLLLQQLGCTPRPEALKK